MSPTHSLWALFLCLACLPAMAAQDNDTQGWKSIEELVDRKPASMATVQDFRYFEPWFAALTPGDYESNRELVKRIASYIAAVEVVARDPQLRFVARGANRRMFALGIGRPAESAVHQTAPVGQADAGIAEPAPFQRQAPAIANVADADRQVAGELEARYEAAAAQATTAWQSAEIIRRNLRARGIELNVQTSVSLARARLYLETASDALRDQAWEEARLNIGRAEYETGKVYAVVGR